MARVPALSLSGIILFVGGGGVGRGRQLAQKQIDTETEIEEGRWMQLCGLLQDKVTPHFKP